MKHKSALRSFLTIASSSLLAISYSHAADGYWNVNANGSWGLNTNWLSSNIADGSGSTAFFTNDITADRTVSLDGDRTLTGLVFGDRATGTAGSWILDNGGTSTNNLILADTTPGITVNALGTNKTATISAIIEGTDGLVKRGIGTLVLSGANTYTGTTTINQGTLTLNSQTGSLNTTTPLTFSGTGTFNMDNVGAGGALTQSLGALTFSAGQGTVQTTRTAAFDQAITFNSLSARTAGVSGNFVNTGTNSATNGFIIATGAPAAGTLIDRGIFYNGSSYATYDAGGFVRGFTAGDTNYLAAPTAAIITASSDLNSNVDLTTGNITAQTTEQANTINMRNFNIAMTGSSPVLSTNGILSNGSTTATLGGGTTPRLQATAAGNEIVMRVNGASDVLTVSSAIQNFNAGGTASDLTKTGAGKLVIGTAHTLTGAINVNAGTLEYATGLGSVNNYTIGSGATLSAFGNSFSGTILNNGSISKAGNAAATFSGDISGTGSFTVLNSAGAVTLSGNNTFSGGLSVTGAGGGTNVFTIGSNGALGTGTFTYNGVTTFNVNVANWVNSNNNPIVLSSSFFGTNVVGSYSTADFGTGAVTLSGANQTITNTGTTVTFGGAIGQDVAGRALTKAGTGTLVLSGSGSNTYSGLTSVSAGTLQLAKTGTANAIAAGGLSVGSGTTVTYTGASTDMIANAAPVTVTGTGLLNLNGVNDTIGALTFTAVAGNNARVTTGAGTLTLGGTVTFTAATTGTAQITGNLDLGAATRTFNVGLGTGSGQDLLINAAISGTGVGITKTGTGRLTLAGGNSYTGLTTVSDGTLTMTAPSSLGNGGLTVAAAKSFIYAPTTAGALNLGSGTITLAGGAAFGTALGGTASQSAITSTGAATLTGTGTINIYGVPGVATTTGTHDLVTAASGLAAGTYTLGTVFNNTNFTVSGFTRSATAISVTATSETALSGNVFWKGGLAGNTGVWAASNGSTQSNWVTSPSGTNQPLTPGAASDLVFSANSPTTMAGMTLGASMTVQSLTINDTATAFGLSDANNALTITPSSASTGITIGSGVLASSISSAVILGANQTWTNDSINALTVSGPISGSGTLTKAGTGTINLTGATNSYAAGTNIAAGTLSFASGALGTAGNITFTGNSTLQWNGSNTQDISSRLVMTNGVTSTIDTQANNVTFASAIGNSSTGSLTKSGGGTLTLSNSSNSYSGGTFINGGKISVAASNPNGALGGSGSNVTFGGTSTLEHSFNTSTGFILGTVAINGAGTVATITKNAGVFNGNLTYTFTTLTGSGTLVAGDSYTGTYDIANASAFTGNIRMQTGSSSAGVNVKINGLADTVGSSVQFTGASNATSTHTLTLNGNSGPLTFNNRQIQITGAGNTGSAYTPTLQNDNTGGNIWVINTDLLNSAGATGGARRLGLAGGNTGNNAFNGVISNGVAGGTIGVTKSGGGTWNVTDASNSYSGGTTVSGGTLGFASGALGTTGAINASGGTLLWLAGNTQDISSRLAMTAATTSTFHTNGNDVNFANAVGSSVAGSLSKTGLGTLTLNGLNTYTGSTTLNAGKLKLNYDTGTGGVNDSKLSNTATTGTLLLNGGTLELSGGSHLETVLSTTLNTGGTFITQPTGGATLSMGAITFTGGAIDFAEDNIATTSTGVTNGILSQRATVAGANFAMKSGSNIVTYDYVGANGSTGYTGTAMSANINYALQTAGGANTLSGTTGATTNTLKIANTATGSLAVAGNTLTLGAILFAGSADYEISTTGSGKIVPTLLHNFGTGGANLTLGALGGALTQFGTGKTILNKDATAAGGLTVNGGTVEISTNAQIGLVASGAGITLNNGTLLASNTLALDNAGSNSRTITLGAGGGTLAAASTKTLTVSGVISGALNPLTVGSSGNTGTVSLSAVNTYSGFTNVDAGTLNVASTGTINTTSAINVAAGGTLRYNSSTALTVAPTLAGNTSSNRAVLGGTGTIAASVTLDNLGDVLSPGNSPGIQTYNANQTWASLTYVWELNDWTDIVAGTDFDQIAITGTLDLSGSAYGFDIVSLNSLNAAGLVGAGGGNLFAETDRSWTILTTTGGITNFNGLEWNINAAGFADSESGSWSIAQSGNNLVLSYASVPEPNVAALIGGFGMLTLLRRRR